jgi:hypothetical protein
MALPRRFGTRSRGAHGAAAVAGPAARRVLFSEVPPEEHASAFLRLRVIGHDPKPALTLVTKRLELRHEIAGARSEGLNRYHDGDVALLIALDEAGLLEVRQQYLADASRHAGRVRKRGCSRCSLLGRPSSERALKPRQVPDGRTAQSLKPLLDVEVSRIEQEDAVRWPPVAPGAPDLLNVLL